MEKTITIVAFGDSITLESRQSEDKRWVRLTESKLNGIYPNKVFRILNSGVGGNTSREGLARIEQDVLSHKPDYVLVEFGGNDPTPDIERYVPFEEYESNLDCMWKKIVNEAKAQMLLLTFPPVINEWHAYSKHQFYDKWGGFENCVEQYRQITMNFAMKHAIVLIDINKALRKKIMHNSASRYILPDGVHLTDNGNSVVAETVFYSLQDIFR